MRDKNKKKPQEVLPLIRVNNMCVTYPNGTEAVKDCSLEIEKGEFVFVVGSSGSGKSSFLKTLLAEIPISSGSVIVAEKRINQLSRHQLPFYRRRVGVVFQEFRLLDDRTIFDNVALAQIVVGASNHRIRKNVMEILEMVGLAGKCKAYPHELSGGEQQRVAIARAMVNRPAILLADEPTGNLDPKNSWDIMNLLDRMNQLGTTIVVVTHNNEIVNTMQKRVITLQHGEVINDEKQGGYVQ